MKIRARCSKILLGVKIHMRKFWKEFKTFISRGNVVEMAVGVIIASAFTSIVTAVTNKIIMPIINWLLALITGGAGLDSIYTFLKKVYTVDAKGNQIVDLTNSIYIDWGAFITAVINFFLIAFILFCILKAFNAAEGALKKARSDMPTREERKELKARGVNVKDAKILLEETKNLRAEKKAKADAEALANKKPTTEELLQDIKQLLQEQSKIEKPQEQEKQDKQD